MFGTSGLFGFGIPVHHQPVQQQTTWGNRIVTTMFAPITAVADIFCVAMGTFVAIMFCPILFPVFLMAHVFTVMTTFMFMGGLIFSAALLPTSPVGATIGIAMCIIALNRLNYSL